MIEVIKKILYAAHPFVELKARLSEREIHVRGISGSLLAFVAASVAEEKRSQMLLLVPDQDTAEKLRDDCALLMGENAVCLFTSSVGHHAKMLDMTSPIAQIETLQKL